MPDPTPAPERSPFLKLLLLVNLTAKPFGRLFEKRFHISLAEWRVMLTVAGRPGLSAADVADALGLDQMAVSRTVRALERRGRIARRPDPADGRRAALELTPEGRALYDVIAPSGLEREAGLLSGLSREERAVLDRMLDKLVDGARRLPDGGSKRRPASARPAHSGQNP